MSSPRPAALPLNLEAIPAETQQRFWRKVRMAPGDGCWTWAGCRNSRGYGCVGINRRVYLAHRVAFVLAGRDLDETLTLDHICRNKLCVRPAHLEQVTHAVNSRRYADSITRCAAGHPLSGENVRVDTRGKRRCLACNRVQNKQWRDRQRGAASR